MIAINQTCSWKKETFRISSLFFLQRLSFFCKDTHKYSANFFTNSHKVHKNIFELFTKQSRKIYLSCAEIFICIYFSTHSAAYSGWMVTLFVFKKHDVLSYKVMVNFYVCIFFTSHEQQFIIHFERLIFDFLQCYEM